MKLSYEDKLEIYELRKIGMSWSQISQRYDVRISNLKYMIKLMDRYGVEIVEKGRNEYYPPELKQEMIDKQSNLTFNPFMMNIEETMAIVGFI